MCTYNRHSGLYNDQHNNLLSFDILGVRHIAFRPVLLATNNEDLRPTRVFLGEDIFARTYRILCCLSVRDRGCLSHFSCTQVCYDKQTVNPTDGLWNSVAWHSCTARDVRMIRTVRGCLSCALLLVGCVPTSASRCLSRAACKTSLFR